MFNFKGKNVLVAGGTGMIGKLLVDLLLQEGAKIRIASLDHSSRAHPKAEFLQMDLTDYNNCLTCCKDIDYVFNLLCVKGSPAVTTVKPASFFVTHLQFNTNLMEAARKSKAQGFLFTSSLAVYSPAEIFNEDDVWKTFPSENDKFAGWAKRMGELQADAYRIEYGWKNLSVVRPANVYGPYDNFNLENSMVVPSLIKKAVDGQNPIRVWGDGSQIRDFIHAEDVARGILLVAQSGEERPINIGSGIGYSIKQLIETIIKNINPAPEIVWETDKPMGDKKRVLDTHRLQSLGFKLSIPLEEGIKNTMDWYQQNKQNNNLRFDIFAAEAKKY